MDAQPDVSLTSVSKNFYVGLFKKKTAVEDLTFSIAPGEVVGLVGPNGSGKSTTLKLILGFLRPSSGEILICGHEAQSRKARSFIGYLPENPRFQRFLTAKEILNYYGKLVGLSGVARKNRIAYLLELVGLDKASDERVRGFSKGMSQRLALAQALLSHPRLMIFDEPMSGLDPMGRVEIRRLLLQVHSEMKQSTIFFSTHLLSDAEQLCSSVMLLKKGRLTKWCPIGDLLGEDESHFEVTVQNLAPQHQQTYLNGIKTVAAPLGLSFEIEGVDLLIRKLSEIRKAGARVVHLASRRKTLEEALFEDELPGPKQAPLAAAGESQ